MIRLNKFLADCGLCSRREADKLIEAGLVTVNGEVASNGRKVSQKDKVLVDGKPVNGVDKKVVLAFYKPVGVTCTEKDKYAEKTIKDCVKYPVRVTYAGRLDKNSEGLLLLTNDGDLIEAMMRGSYGHEKEYVVKVHKEITDEFLEKMSQGVFLKELQITTRPCKIEKINNRAFRIILTQGVNRQIRRMCQTFGYVVEELKRIRVMNIVLGELKKGEYRELTKEEISALYKLAGLDKSAH